MAIKTVKLVASSSYLAPYYAATNHIEDTRNVNPTPKTVETQTVKYDFKLNTLIDVPDTTYSYCVVQTIRPWSDNSGGLPIQIAYKKRQSDSLPMMYIRCSNDDLSGWNSWYEIYHSGNFSVKSVEDKIDDVIDGTLSAYYAQKLKYPRAINLSTAVSATGVQFDGSKDITIPVNSVYADYVSWGNKASITSLTPLDVAYLPGESANRFAGVTANALKFERSEDGLIWTTYTNNSWVNIFTNNSQFGAGNTASDKNANRQFRITLDCKTAGLYCNLRNILIYYSTNGATGTYMTLERGDYSSPTVWHTLLNKVNINGWSGWNHYYCNEIIGSDTYGNKTRYLRFTFGCTGVSDTYTSNFSVMSIKGISDVCWNKPSDYANYGVPYIVNSTGNELEVTTSYPWYFSKPITANSGITGNLTGTAEYANYVNITAGNEIKIAGEASGDYIWVLYRGATSTKKITGVHIGDGTGTGTHSDIYVNKVYLNGTTSIDDIYATKESVTNLSNSITIELSKKLDEISSSSTYTQVYTKLNTGVQTMYNLSKDAVASTIVYRTPEGRVATAKGSSDTDAANMQNIADVQTSISNLSTSIANTYAKKSDLTAVYKYKGSVVAYSNLPSSASTGDVYNVEAAYGNNPVGTNYAWTGSAWDPLGGSVDLTNYVTAASTAGASALIVTSSASGSRAIAWSPYSVTNILDNSSNKIPVSQAIYAYVTNNLVDRSSVQTITGQKTFTNMQLFDDGLQSNSFVRAEQYVGSGGTIIIQNDTSTMTFGARTLGLTIVSYGRPNVKEYYNTSNYYTREVAYVSDLSSFVKVSGSLSTSGRIVTVASTTGYINQSNYSINTTVFNDATQVPTSKAVYEYVTPVLGNTRTASSMVLELTVGSNKDSISISQASANYAGLMTASMYNTMQSLETIDNNYQKKIVEEITGTMGSVGGTLYFNAIATKFVYEGLTKISGSIKISSYSSSETYKYRIINPATFNSKLSSNVSVTISKFLKGWWWASLKSTSDGSILGYGTDASIESNSYIGFGRIYTTSGSRGSWAQDTFYNNCANGVLHFEVWFTV